MNNNVAVYGVIQTLLPQLDFRFQRASGFAQSYVNEEAQLQLVLIPDKEDIHAASVCLYTITMVVKHDMVWVSDQDAHEVVTMLHRFGYGPATKLHRQRLLSLLHE